MSREFKPNPFENSEAIQSNLEAERFWREHDTEYGRGPGRTGVIEEKLSNGGLAGLDAGENLVEATREATLDAVAVLGYARDYLRKLG